MDPPSSFNDIHTSFVTTEDGTTLSELLQVLGSISLTPILVSLLIPWVVPPSFVKQAVISKDVVFLIKVILEYPVLAVLPVWILTLFAGDFPLIGDETNNDKGSGSSSGVVLVILLVIPLGILTVNHAVTAPKWLGFRSHWNKIKDQSSGWIRIEDDKTKKSATPETMNKLPFITNYRGIVIYITILSILAVDFSIFPRRFAKTRTFGISLMDVGTGCFVFANGIVSPEARNKKSPLKKSLKSTIPLIVLGFIRLVSVKGIEYQEVTDEYGVHWNFFFTLAGIKLLSSLIFTYFNSGDALKLATLLCIFYEILLNYKDFQNEYIMNPDVLRSANLVNANREGIFSLMGYLSIYMASVYFGRILYWKVRISISDWIDYAFQSLLQIIVLWTIYNVYTYFGFRPSRRIANAGYILLMVALNYTLLWFQMFTSLVQVGLQHTGLLYGPLIFYELSAKQRIETERIQRLQKMTKDFRGFVGHEVEESDEILDEKLSNLEDRLQETFEKLNDSQKLNQLNDEEGNELLTKIQQLEDEIENLEYKLSDIGSREAVPSKQKNLVLLPDLSKSPIILEAICYNGLVVFLLGNLLTGLINCAIYTMYTPPYLSLCYLWLYSTLISASSVILYWYEIQLKFW